MNDYVRGAFEALNWVEFLLLAGMDPEKEPFGTGILRSLCTELKAGTGETRPSFVAMKAGMTKIMERFPSHNVLDAIAGLRQLGFNPVLLGSVKYSLGILKSMNPKDIKECKEILTSVHGPRLKKFSDSHAAYPSMDKYRITVEKASLEKLAKMLKVLSFLAQTKVYLLWKKAY